ncbi:OmpA family protein [Skermanella pratensis]|uniref:OmpA family protein n=1 Tax=Skermanella pratensis TaxID=2233999 RepID=UPI00130142EE|nr:OmpA family protein [Skermanella pratensis]
MTSNRCPISVPGRTAADRPLRRRTAALVAVLLLAAVPGCALQMADETASLPPAAAPASAATLVSLPVPPTPMLPPPPSDALPLDEAVERAAAELFASLPAEYRPGASPQRVVIDPLVDGATGAQTASTRTMEQRLATYIREEQPDYELQPLNTATLGRSPLVLVGSLRGAGSAGLAPGVPQAYRIWFSLADLRTGIVVGHGMAWAQAGEVDTAPTEFFRDSPAWLVDSSIQGYLRTCLSRVGEPVAPDYLEGILTSALVADAIQAYEEDRHAEALDLFQAAERTSAGNQLRVHNGLYLANWQLGREGDAEGAFSQLVDFGLRHDRMALMMLFRPASTAYWPDPQVSGPYGMWLRQIARRVGPSGKCVELVGHTSPTGPIALNDQLSLARAEKVWVDIARESAAGGERITTRGLGSSEPIVGSGRDDASDMLDRRVEFRPTACQSDA